MKRDYKLFVQDILQAIKDIEIFVKDIDYTKFSVDEKTKITSLCRSGRKTLKSAGRSLRQGNTTGHILHTLSGLTGCVRSARKTAP